MNLDFDIKELPNIKFSIESLREYYETVKNNFQHLKWTANGFDQKNHKVSELYSWAIQSNLKDISKPCPPYDIKHDIEVIGTFDNPTELLFGFGKIVVDAIPNIRQTVISAHPRGTVIEQHIDNTEFLKIHIPIYTNDESYFSFGDKNYNLQAGKAYLVNTTKSHGTVNDGTDDRIHFIFKIPIGSIDEILTTTWIFDPSLIDFDLLEIDNIIFNHQELIDYYMDIKNNYKYLRWELPETPNTRLGGLYGYGILSNKDDIEMPVDPPGTRTDKSKYDPLIKPTKILKGFAKKLYEKIPYIEELVITGHPYNSGIPPHTDKDEHIRIHIPITAGDKSYFVINDKRYILETSKAYVVNTKRIHTTINESSIDRIHLHFKIPIGKLHVFLQKKFEL